MLKDPYCFDFLTLGELANNRELENNTDKPSIGLILRKENNRIVAEYALRDMSKPMGIAEWKTDQIIPAEFKGQLPTIEELEGELQND